MNDSEVIMPAGPRQASAAAIRGSKQRTAISKQLTANSVQQPAAVISGRTRTRIRTRNRTRALPPVADRCLLIAGC
ncbi:MAG TPA: hypothetical protein VLT32_20020 [Candidatus Sulfomarinibacteraceae bacterium]|nr:hypothetical protein [Candidatus Sulfomarinibacteraceae bacterium]